MDKSKVTNPWQLKPWWCQPWSILLTGVSIIGGSWWLGHKIWLTLLVAGPISVWMGFFLLVWPKLMQAQLLEAGKDEG
ncbi:MAG: hypothetical protein Fur0025_10390 [Oscillatoriaceae cyanobacterium]|uniref:DUF6737 family protein n=1 Tax=[Phormidium] sp. ETS-05 TaxID=222819 RepID=UPI0018EED522|nr:DUF6737 family protein [[Phormidium] sp. ETS-05]